MQKSRYGNTDVNNEYLRYPLNGPIKYEVDYTGTYSKYSIVDKNYVDTLVKPHKRLISGGAEWSTLGTTLTFALSPISYSFTGEIMNLSANPSPGLSFDQGDSGLNRIDAIVVNEGGSISIVKGTPASIPVQPTISESQILVQYAYISDSSTKIGDTESIYQNGSQWSGNQYQLSGVISGTVDFNNVDDYISGSSIDVNTDYRTGIKLTKPIGPGLTASLYGSLSMRVKFTSVVPEQKSLFVQIQGTANGAAVFGNTVNLMTFGLQRDVVNSWQHVVVPTSKFGNQVSLIQSMTMRMAGGASGSNTNWRADYILLQRGFQYDGYTGEPDSMGGIGSGSGGSSTGGVIGPAEDGSYTDGLYTDFNVNTPIGTAIDRFNELFLALVPASAPALSDWNATRTGGVNGKLSFDDSNPIAGASYSGANTAPSSPISSDGLWTASGKRLGIFASSSTNNLTGILASNTAASTTVPTPAYAAYSFGDATVGNITLNINGQIVSTASLSSTNAAINNTSSSTISGFVLSAATSSKFPTGTPFDNFQNRTGTWFVKSNDSRIRNGYNYIIAEHKSNTFTRTLSRVEFIQDDNTIATTFSSGSIASYTLTGEKYLSGIKFYTGGTINYDAQIGNLYRNTYYSGSDGISFNDASATGNAGTTPLLTLPSSYTLVAGAGNELKNVILSTDYGSGSPISIPIISSTKRRLNDPISVSLTAKRTLQGTVTGATATISNVYLDNISVSSNSSTSEGFDDELYRLRTGSFTYSLISDISSGTWSGTFSLTNGGSEYNDGLQVYNSKLIYPITNFSSQGILSTNPNYGNAGSDYSSATGTRTYIRSFYNATTYGNFTINIAGSGGTFVAKTTSLTGNNIWLEMKLPGSSSATTGWLDCYTDFNATLGPVAWDDGRGGRKASAGAGRAFGTTWGLTTGARNNSTSGGYVVIKITVAQGFTGEFTGIAFAWG